MTNTPDITPPPELVQEWWEQADQYQDDPRTYFDYVATEAARWGADQELKACCEWFADDVVSEVVSVVAELRAARRPKPLSLKEQALEGLTRLVSTGEFFSNQMKDLDTIRRALEALDD
jgi:hypothetical protein